MEAFPVLSFSVDECSGRNFQTGFGHEVDHHGQLWKISFAKFESQNQIFLSIAFEVTMPHIGDCFLRSVISLDKQTYVNNPIVFDHCVRFVHGKAKWPVPKLVGFDVFMNPANGFLVGDSADFTGYFVGIDVQPLQFGEFCPSYAPLLHYALSTQPSILEILANREVSNNYALAALHALGALLHFFSTTELSNIDENNCAELKASWKAARKYELELDWLRPCYDDALKAAEYLKIANRVTRLELDYNVLHDVIVDVSKLEASFKSIGHEYEASQTELAGFAREFYFARDFIGFP